MSTDRFKVFGILNCEDDRLKDKVTILRELVRIAKHEDDRFTKKEFTPAFEQLCALASWELFSALVSMGKSEQVYDEYDCNKLKESVPSLADKFLEEVFGSQSEFTFEQLY